MMEGKLLIISGFSGVGKGTVIQYMLEHYKDYVLSVSATTRQPREKEIDGIHYHFISESEFEKMIEQDKLLEYANYVRHYYGTPKDFVIENIQAGRNVILEIETVGALKVKEKIPDAVMIFILPPDGATLKERLIGRQTESSEVIAQRLKKAAEETQFLENYEYFVVNDTVASCAKNVDKIIKNASPHVLNREQVLTIKNDILRLVKGD